MVICDINCDMKYEQWIQFWCHVHYSKIAAFCLSLYWCYLFVNKHYCVSQVSCFYSTLHCATPNTLSITNKINLQWCIHNLNLGFGLTQIDETQGLMLSVLHSQYSPMPADALTTWPWHQQAWYWLPKPEYSIFSNNEFLNSYSHWVSIGFGNGLMPSGTSSPKYSRQTLQVCWHEEPGQQQPCYWAHSPKTFRPEGLTYPIILCHVLKTYKTWILTHCSLMMLYGNVELVNIGSSNGLVPGGTKPLPEPMLTYHQ